MVAALSLKPIDRTDRGLTRIRDALSIYRETILPEAQNPERQILYWIDHNKSQLSDKFRCFAIQRQNIVIGYLQYSYFSEENIIFFEYLCLKESGRRGLMPSGAISLIEDHLGEHYGASFLIVFEVAHLKREDGSWVRDSRLFKYFIRLGFRVVEFKYRYPVLQTYDGQVSYPADLLVRLPAGRKQITSTELRTILRCVYFKHYLRWDRPFLEPDRFAEREKLINELYSHQASLINSGGDINTFGDNSRSDKRRFASVGPQLSRLLEKLFGPKFFRIAVILMLLAAVQRLLSTDWLLVPAVLAASLLYCLAEDTAETRKLVTIIVKRLSVSQPRKW